jgi:hypothetical protein
MSIATPASSEDANIPSGLILMSAPFACDPRFAAVIAAVAAEPLLFSANAAAERAVRVVFPISNGADCFHRA